MKYILRREGNPRVERAVRVIRHRDGKSWWINPVSLVFYATGVSLRRDYCILSFAAGLRDAGHEVVIDDSRHGHVCKYPFAQTGPVVTIFWLVGYAWGLGLWTCFTDKLRNSVQHNQIFTAMEATAEFTFFCRPKDFHIVLPLK
ncbi:MAG: hypothetical protein P1P90_04440 [Patescibacteria group bacterium]|nr:hypothetical protein [Patescibacteria group bacterium]